MSYARFGQGDSDVYILATGYGLECMACSVLNDGLSSFITHSGREMLAHMDAHIARGDRVPASAFEAIRREIASDGDEF